ncbi:hypothetical protein CONPUDRAFT_160328 [Coniophora puteana RWD-64-598 SS2]|uniref:Transcription factor TFIIIC triple barrel domain-containing protein n=1 Tax=Coniophora puteana (strain RWD-64-598) TaxID=741705 RepID=R7SDP4_CONPW|nr:uncharacterized protein CONPUDRAFT_160328 [Coniophora puteana RWD-64-598 SS2]EIW74288.1 hypothetical protein CONPUDRAFT_160328 [Coniophora puteana RWD-64-598 SS2]
MASNTQRLLPGYRQVTAFDDDDEYESGEEVEYVTLDLGAIEPLLVPSTDQYALIGLDTPTPFLQLSGTVLRGKHDELIGTEMLFSDERDQDAEHREKRSLTHVASTSRRIRFRPVELRPRGADKDDAPKEAPLARTRTRLRNDALAAASAAKGKAKDNRKIRDVTISEALEEPDVTEAAEAATAPATAEPEEAAGPSVSLERITGENQSRRRRSRKKKGKEKEEEIDGDGDVGQDAPADLQAGASEGVEGAMDTT